MITTYNEFCFKLVRESKIFILPYDIIKPNEQVINHVQANFSPGWHGNICSPSNFSVCSTKYCNCLGRSIMLGYVDIENKINSSLHK